MPTLEIPQRRDRVFNPLLHLDTQCPFRPIIGRPRLLASFDDDV